MKKSNILLWFSLLPFSLLSCQTNEDKIISDKILIKKCEGITSMFHLLSVEELYSVTRYEDCVLFVSLPNCTHCEKERGFLEEYIQKNETILYEVSFSIYQEAYDDASNSIGDYAFQYPKVTGTPTYLFYKEGRLKNSHIGGFGIDSYSDFVTSFEEYVHPINLYMCNDYYTGKENDGLVQYHYFDNSEALEETKNLDILGFSTAFLKDKIKKNKDITILYTWRRCQDCKSLQNALLYTYLLKNTSKKLFYYETDGYMLLKRMQEEKYQTMGLNLWSTFSLDFNLIDDTFYYQDKLNNHAGLTPTIVNYKDTIFYKKDIYLNEMNEKINEDNTLSYSFAFHDDVKEIKSNTKIVNEDKSSSTYQKALKEIQEGAKKIDLEKMKTFLDEVL